MWAHTHSKMSGIQRTLVQNSETVRSLASSTLITGTTNFASNLCPESRKTMTFSTPWGNYRYKRLAFRGVNSQDLFEAEVSKIISGIPKVLNNRDNNMISGRDWDNHNKNLKQLLQRSEDHNLTLRREKCEFGKTSVDFHGHLFTAKGLKPSPTKIQAVQNCFYQSPKKS